MSPSSPEPSLDAQDASDVTVVDGEVVEVATTIHELPYVDATAGGTVERARPSAGVVAARTAAVVTTGFVAGAIASAVVARKASAARRRRGARGLPAVAQSRRYLVDVHLLGDR